MFAIIFVLRARMAERVLPASLKAKAKKAKKPAAAVVRRRKKKDDSEEEEDEAVFSASSSEEEKPKRGKGKKAKPAAAAAIVKVGFPATFEVKSGARILPSSSVHCPPRQTSLGPHARHCRTCFLPSV
jgi:hypothetical protein